MNPRCPTHHYLSGSLCQLDVDHAGPCLADFVAGWVYAWHQPAGEPACNQTPCPKPRACTCAAGQTLGRKTP